MHITEDLLPDIALVRLPKTDRFFPILPDTGTQINDALLANRTGESNSPIIFTDRYAILIESSLILTAIVIENTATSPRILSIRPGESKHYFKNIQFKKSDGILNAFWPIHGDRFDRHFIVEELQFPNDAQFAKFAEKLAISSSQIQWRNVYIHSQNGSILRIFFQTENDKTFMIVGNKINDFDHDVNIKGIHELSPEVVKFT